jgi:hypothetical protein
MGESSTNDWEVREVKTKLQQWQIVHKATGQRVGEPGYAQAISDRCSDLNDAANPDPDKLRVVVYGVVKG